MFSRKSLFSRWSVRAGVLMKFSLSSRRSDGAGVLTEFSFSPRRSLRAGVLQRVSRDVGGGGAAPAADPRHQGTMDVGRYPEC